jgi:hypothetical protein
VKSQTPGLCADALETAYLQARCGQRPSPTFFLPCRRSRVRIPSAALSDQALQSLKRCLGAPAPVPRRLAREPVGALLQRHALSLPVPLMASPAPRCIPNWRPKLTHRRERRVPAAVRRLVASDQVLCHHTASKAIIDSGSTWPPSTTMVWPVMYDASSVARNRAAWPMSSTLPSLRCGIEASILRR